MHLSIRKSIVVPAAGLAAMLLVGIASADNTTPPPPPPPLSGAPVFTTPTPVAHVTYSSQFHLLNKKARKKIVAIAKKDKAVKKFLKGKSYKSTVTTWVNPVGQVVGGIVSLRFTHGYKLKGTWATLDFGCGTPSAAYKSVPYTATYTNVGSLTVNVDLKAKKVVAIVPMGSVSGKVQYTNPHDAPQICHS